MASPEDEMKFLTALIRTASAMPSKPISNVTLDQLLSVRKALYDETAKVERLKKLVIDMLGSDMAMREEDEGRLSPELEAIRAELKECS